VPTIDVTELTRSALDAARALLGRACEYDPAAAVAEEKLFGGSPPAMTPCGTLGAFEDGVLVGVTAHAGRWLRLIAVDPPARRRGVGHALLDEVMRRARHGGVAKLRVGDQPGNYLAPGVDERNGVLLEFLEKRGFQWWGANMNLRVDLTAANPLVSRDRAAALAAEVAGRGYRVRRAERGRDAAALADLAGSFSPAWAFEAERALALPVPGVHVAEVRDTGKLAAFAVHDGNNAGLGWFGPTGTRPEHRGKGIGAGLLLACLRDVADAGHREAIVAWVGPSEFYVRTVGAVEDRHFVVMERPL
jgi:GNAT superfamily N-acetyltransferase